MINNLEHRMPAGFWSNVSDQFERQPTDITVMATLWFQWQTALTDVILLVTTYAVPPGGDFVMHAYTGGDLTLLIIHSWC